MSRSTPPFPTSLRLNPTASAYTQKQVHLSTKFFSPAPILRFTVGKFSQLPPAEGPEVVVLGRSNVGKSSLLNTLFPASPPNFARVSSKPGHTKTLNGYTIPTRKFTIIDLPGYGFRGREEWEKEVWELIRTRRDLKKAYVLLDALHGPKEKDLDMLSELAKTGLAHQLVLTKLDRASATVWTELAATLRQNPVRVAAYKSATRILPNSKPTKSVEELQMGVWAPLRGKLGLGCDETILGVSSEEGWGITALRCSILAACGAFKRDAFHDMQYLKALQETPIIDDKPMDESLEEGDQSVKLSPRQNENPESQFEDDNPMRGKVFGGSKMLKQKIYRW